MSKIAVFFAEGFEEIEALTVIDLCRRAGITIDMVSVTGACSVQGSHGITVELDQLFSEIDCSTYDMLILPGGMPGTKNLEAHTELMQQLDAFYEAKKYLGAICAAPSIFGHRGYLKGRKACCYPSWEEHLEGADVSKEVVEISDHVITSRGMGTAVDFALAVVSVFCGKECAEQLAETIVYQK